MKITFHGAAQTVTGSQYLLEVNGHKVLLECGLFQGARREAFEINRTFWFDPAEVKAVLLTHAHIDHSGNLPSLVKNGFRGPIYATHVSKHLIELMLADSAHIQEADARFLNEKNKGKNEPRVEPLYTIEEAKQVHALVVSQPYKDAFEVVPGLKAGFVEAGHILGSASIAMEVEEKGKKFNFWFSGDIGRPHLPIVRDPVLPVGADYLLMESTYGDKPHVDHREATDRLREVVGRTVKRGGKVIIPAFAVGRTQELVYSLHSLMESGDVPRVPVIVDSPLAANVSEIFRNHTQYFDKEAREMMDNGHDVLGFKMLTYVQSVEESIEVNIRKEPMVVISASGMAESGRILHHLRHNLDNPQNTVLIVSYQAQNTLGRRLAQGEPQVKIFGDVYEVKAEVLNIEGFSAHAGQNYLREYALAAKETVKEVYLVHGEEPAAKSLRKGLLEGGVPKVFYPYPQQTLEVGGE